jgi:RNA polymerase sigma-B factor
MTDPEERRRANERFVEYRRTHDRALRNELIEEHIGLAKGLARRFGGRGEAREDLVQVAMVGLLKAVERFEPERGLAFTTFATPTITGELKRHFRDKAWSVRIPRRTQEHVGEVGRAIQSASQRLGRAPSIAELAAETGLTEEEVIEAMEANQAFTAASIDAEPAGEGSPVLRDTLAGREVGFDDVESRVLVDRLLEALDERDRTIITLRFFGGLTQSEIAEQIGVSQMHVSRLLARSLAKLRAELLAEAG